MRSNDSRADNLLLRVFSYTPRPGRAALEDFCTETLAWCLRNSELFRERFFDLINLQNMGAKCVAVATQNAYDYEDNQPIDNQLKSDTGRFDLIIQIGVCEILIVVETKVGSPFGSGQLSRYREELKRQQRSLGYKKVMLVTITDEAEHPDGSDVHRTWAAIQTLLEMPSTESLKVELTTAICAQFSEFLKEKGLGRMNIPKITSAPLDQWMQGIKFRDSLENVLKSVVNDSELALIFGRKRITYEETDDEKIWVGIYGSQSFWLGFGFRKDPKTTEVFALVQRGVVGDRRLEFPKLKSEFSEGKTWLNIEQRLNDEFDGDGDKIKEWLVTSAKWLLKIE